MIENCIGVMPLPLGLGLGFKINGKSYMIPMAIEEPSVIAACSAIAKIIGEKGSGF
jgi:hydroxymethylglutaryl-CoA reductase